MISAQELSGATTAGVLADKIRQMIVFGRLRPGEILRQEALAAQFAVSRSPVREALRLLEAEGLVVYRSNRGAIVAAADVAGAREHFEIRRLLEPSLIGRVVGALDDRALADAAARYTAFCEARDPNAFVRSHWLFHESLYRHAGRPLTLNAVYRSQIRVSYRPDMQAVVAVLRGQVCAIDKRILNACERGDRQAAIDLTLQHIDDTERLVLPMLGEPERGDDVTSNAG
jgi:DNA-binding GntR family transcriptional regulator